MYNITFMQNLKQQKASEYNKKETHRFREQTSGYPWRYKGRDQRAGGAHWWVYTRPKDAVYELEIEPIFCNNCKWGVSFKNCVKIK